MSKRRALLIVMALSLTLNFLVAVAFIRFLARPTLPYIPPPILNVAAPTQAALDLRATRVAQQAFDYFDSFDCTSGDWLLDRSSLEAYEASVAPLRQELRDTLELQTLPISAAWEERREEIWRDNGLRYEYVWASSRLDGVQIEGILITPEGEASSQRPGVLALHGSDSVPGAVAGLPGFEDYSLAFGQRLAEAGAVVFAPYLNWEWEVGPVIHHLARDVDAGTVMNYKWQMALSALDVLDNHTDGPLGVYGISWGGWLASLLAALEPRVEAVVVSGWTRDFWRWIEEGRAEVGDRRAVIPFVYAPNFWCRFNGDRQGQLAIPRPVLYEIGRYDVKTYANDWAIFTVPLDAIGSTYEALGIGERFAIAVFEGEHVADGTEAIPWLMAQLQEVVDHPQSAAALPIPPR